MPTGSVVMLPRERQSREGSARSIVGTAPNSTLRSSQTGNMFPMRRPEVGSSGDSCRAGTQPGGPASPFRSAPIRSAAVTAPCSRVGCRMARLNRRSPSSGLPAEAADEVKPDHAYPGVCASGNLRLRSPPSSRCALPNRRLRKQSVLDCRRDQHRSVEWRSRGRCEGCGDRRSSSCGSTSGPCCGRGCGDGSVNPWNCRRCFCDVHQNCR